MKLAFSLTLVFVSLATIQAQGNSIMLPHQIHATLDSGYRGWAFVDNFRVLQDPTLQLDTSKCHPNLVWGDFDGDGNRDYAVYIQHPQESAKNKRSILAFLHRGKLYEQHLLMGGGDYVWLVEKGAVQYDYDTGKYFRLKHDAVADVTIEKGSVTHIYEDGSFKRVITSD